MFKNVNNFLNILKTNKKLLYTFCFFILLVVVALMLKIDILPSGSPASTKQAALGVNIDDGNNYDEYVASLEKKLESIISEIEGVEKVKTMIYTKNSAKLEPVFNENTNTESNIETGSDGVRREQKRDNLQKQVEVKDSKSILEKYYEYPDISGVLIVVDYSGDQNIYKILINSVKVLLDIELNNIEIIVSNAQKKGGN
jgi:stage III sporulation protein AG